MSTPGRAGRASHPDRVLLVLVLAAGPLVALGLARFAYALLLPPMRTELGWSYSQAGALNTANAAGYLAGALVATGLARRHGTRRAFLAGCVLTTAALALTPVSTTYGVLLATRLLAGVGGALVLVLGAALVTGAGAGGSPRRAAAMLGLYFGGAGGGMTVAGLLVPWVLDVTDGRGWREGWLILAGIAAAATTLIAVVLHHVDEPPQPRRHERDWRRGRVGWLTAAYTLYGMGYIAYLTFIVALLDEHGVGGRTTAVFYVLLGVAASVGGLAWARPIGRLGGAGGMSAVLVALAAGTLLPVMVPSVWAFVASAVLVGGSFLSAATAMSLGVRSALDPPLWTAGLAFTTGVFGVGQTLGPWAAGWVADRFADLGAGLVFSAVLLLLGAAVALPQRAGGSAPPATPTAARQGR